MIGNPPFLGGTKITGALGVTYREAIIESIALDVRSGGRCDLVAYFLLRALSLLCEKGQIGLIATNTLVQGDTREVGIEQVLAGGSKLRRAVKSRAWPSSSVSLEYCGVWITREPQGHSVSCWLDERPVPGITSALEPVSRVTGNPNRLKENQNICFEGSKVTGMGFVLDGTVAEE
ncbi:DNA methyltransferase, partial [Frankia umida]|uniref:DNA methyltransferase n=1 Tax=Frankia umida TaxID=573489 RepID=UPI0035577168